MQRFYLTRSINQKMLQKMQLIMKLSFVLIMIGTICLYANTGYAQDTRVNLHLEKASLTDVFREIEKQSDYRFFYNNAIVNAGRKVDLNANNESISSLLNDLFQGTDINYRMVENYIVITHKGDGLDELSKAIVQGVAVTGMVIDENGEPMPGVNVVIKGTSTGVITGSDGKYTITIPNKDVVLTFSFMGYTSQESIVGDRITIDIVLAEDTKEIEEVVVIGYGTAKKKDITGSVVRADITKLRESPNVSLGQSLQGTVPGLNVGAVTEAGKDPDISIRGRNSISGTTSPLIVLDGIIYRGSLVDINPSDIESIDILKDASAAAIYGSQASNGVMLITSKTGTKMSKPIIEYSGTFTLQQSTNQKMRPMDRDGFLQLVADRFLTESRTGADLLTPNPSWDVTKHLMDANAVNGYLAGVNTDWWDLGTKDHPYIQMHNLSVRGRNELSSYFMSIGLTDQQNLVINDVYKRYNIRLNMDMKITDWLKVGTQSFFTLSDWSGIASVEGGLPPVCPSVDETGEYIIYPYKGTLNPALSRQQDDVNKRYNISGNFYADINLPFIKGLNYRLNFSQSLILDKRFTFNPWGANLLGSGSKQNDSQYIWTADNILTYKRMFGKHDINSTFVYGVEKRQWERTKAEGSDFSNDALGYNFLGAADAARQVISSDAWEESSLYAMLRLGYTYDSRYSFTGTIRRDGFSGFGKNNKFALFPSAAVAWRLSEEDFIKNIEWIDDLKLRFSYGANGNRTVGRYATLAKMVSSNAYLYGDGAPAEKGLRLSAMANNDLKWETTDAFNFGVEYGVLSRRLFGNIDYYNSSTYDLLYDINIPVMNNNISTIPTNIGKMKNHGVELSITGIPVQKKDISWEITFNYSINRNKIVSILGLDKDGDGKEDDLVASKIFIDHPYGVCYDFEQIGMWQMADHQAGVIPTGFTYGTYKVRDINEDGNYTAADDRKILGYTSPSYRFSIESVLRYKNWELKAFINSIQGGKDYYYAQPGSVLANPDNIYQSNSFKWDYWTPENPDARYRQIGFFTPALGDTYSPYIQRSFIRLQNVTLSYRLPSALLKKININNFKIYVTGTNLLTITDWDGWDPETGSGLGGNYPLLRTYSLGINFDF